jgi:hypothetical protein
VNGSIGELSLEAFYRVADLLATSRRIMQLQKSSYNCALMVGEPPGIRSE